MQILRDAWLTQIGHTRPKMTRGQPIPSAQARATALTAQIDALLAALPAGLQ